MIFIIYYHKQRQEVLLDFRTPLFSLNVNNWNKHHCSGEYVINLTSWNCLNFGLVVYYSNHCNIRCKIWLCVNIFLFLIHFYQFPQLPEKKVGIDWLNIPCSLFILTWKTLVNGLIGFGVDRKQTAGYIHNFNVQFN